MNRVNVFVIGLALVLAVQLKADVIYVNALVKGAGNGTAWLDAYADLQTALELALDGDEIWVVAGTYKPTDGINRESSFLLKEGVSLYGGFIGNEASRDHRDWSINKTILSGDIGEPDDNTDNSYSVVTGANDASLDGFTIMGGNANVGSWGSSYLGGGMYNYQCSPTISNCIFTENSAVIGGGMANFGSVIVADCLFDNNHANEGAGIYNNGHDIVSQPSVTNCNFTRNRADSNGGGVYNYMCRPTINKSVFVGNRANDYWGGAIYNYYSQQILTNCVFCGNSAMYGGGIYDWGGWGGREIVNCSFSGNVAVFNGGGLYCFENTSILTNSILWGNSAVNGSQIYDHSSELSVIHSNVQGGWEGEGNIDVDPSFIRMPDDGGDGWGIGENDYYGDLRLLYSSPCIDAGTEADVHTDLEGNTRPFDYPDIDNNGDLLDLDMGAYELSTTCSSFPIMDANKDCKVNFIDFAVLASEWLICNVDPPERC